MPLATDFAPYILMPRMLDNAQGVSSKIVLLHLSNKLTNPRPTGIFLKRAPLGGGGLFRAPPISENTGPILKIQAAFESPGKIVDGKQILMTSGSPVTSQVRSR